MSSFALLKENLFARISNEVLREQISTVLEEAEVLQRRALKIAQVEENARLREAALRAELETAREGIEALWAANAELRNELEAAQKLARGGSLAAQLQAGRNRYLTQRHTARRNG